MFHDRKLIDKFCPLPGPMFIVGDVVRILGQWWRIEEDKVMSLIILVNKGVLHQVPFQEFWDIYQDTERQGW